MTNTYLERIVDSRVDYLHTVVFDDEKGKKYISLDIEKINEGNNISCSLTKSVLDKNSTDIIVKDEISINKSKNNNQYINPRLPYTKLLIKDTKFHSRNAKMAKRADMNNVEILKDSLSKIITEKDFKIENYKIPSLGNDVDISISNSTIKHIPIGTQNIVKRIITSESRMSYSRVPNESRISLAKEEILNKEISILKNSLYKTKPAKIFPSSRKSRSNLISRGTEIYCKKNKKDYLSNYKFLFEDIENKKTHSIHQTSLRSSLHHKLNHKNEESDECDLSNFSRHFNSNSVVKTLNTSYNVTKVDESTKGNSFHGKKNFKS